MLMVFSLYLDSQYLITGSGIFGIRDFTKKRCGIQDLAAPGKRDLLKLGMECRISICKKSGMQESCKKGAGMRDQDPPPLLPDPVTRFTFMHLAPLLKLRMSVIYEYIVRLQMIPQTQ